MAKKTQDEVVPIHRAAAMLGVHPRTLINWHKAGTLVPYRVGGILRKKRFYLKSQLDALMKEQV